MALDRYWHHVGTVLTGTVVAQIIPVVGALVIARQYTPVDFGAFSAWLGVVLFLSVILTGRFEIALAIVPDGDARRLAVLATLVTSILAAFVAAVFCGVIVQYIPAMGNGISPSMVVMLVPTALAVAMAQTWQSWAAAEGSYRDLSFMRIAQASAITICQIGAGIFSPSASSLAFAHLGGAIVGLALSAYLIPLSRFPKDQAKRTVLEFWNQYRRFPIFSLPADSINTAAAQLPVIIVAARFGTDIAGLLALTMRILGAPIGLLGKSVLDVFKRHAAASYRERGECRMEYVRTFNVLAIASLGFCVVMASVSEPLFALAFGENWRGAGTIAIWLLPLFALRFMASPLSYMVYIAGKQHIDLVWQVTLLVMTISALNISHNHAIALKAYSAGYSLLYMVYLAMSYRFSQGDTR